MKLKEKIFWRWAMAIFFVVSVPGIHYIVSNLTSVPLPTHWYLVALWIGQAFFQGYMLAIHIPLLKSIDKLEKELKFWDEEDRKTLT